jgi:hypothetical protein
MGGPASVGRFGGGAWGRINAADLDGDGLLDVVAVFGAGGGAKGTYSGLYVYHRLGEARDNLLDAGLRLAPLTLVGENTPLIGDADGDGRPDIYCGGWLFLNRSVPGSLRFARPRRAPKPDWPDPGTMDWNGDGVPDHFVEDMWHLRLVDGKTGAASYLQVGDSDLLQDIFIRPCVCDWNGDGHHHILIGQESGHITWIENRDGRLLLERYLRQRAPNVKSGCLSVPTVCDWNGDGDLDLIVGNAAGFIEYFEYKNGVFLPPVRLQADGKEIRILAGESGSIQGALEARWGYTNPTVADWDLDGDLDLLVGCVTGEVFLFENIGSRQSPRLAAPQKLQVDWGDRPPVYPAGLRYTPGKSDLITQWRCRPQVLDWDGDGLPDLIAVDAEGFLAWYPRYRRADGRLGLRPPEHPFLYENGQPIRFCNSPEPGKNGRIVFALADWDGDGDLDIIRNGGPQHGTSLNSHSNFAWLECLRRESEHRAIYRWRGELIPSDRIRLQGHNTSPYPVDINGDGRLDLISGCEDGNLYWFSRDWIDHLL